MRPGDNKWSMGIFARDADSGMARWVYHVTPHELGALSEWMEMGVQEAVRNSDWTVADCRQRAHRRGPIITSVGSALGAGFTFA